VIIDKIDETFKKNATAVTSIFKNPSNGYGKNTLFETLGPKCLSQSRDRKTNTSYGLIRCL